MTNWFEMISKPTVRFFNNNNREMTKIEVEEFFFNPAEIQFPSNHGMFVSHYFLSFWSALLGDEVALFYLKLIDWYVYGGDKDFCFPSAGRIAKDFRMSPNTVRSRLKTLEEYGFVARFTVKDVVTKQHFSSLIKIRKDIPLIPQHILEQLPTHIQQAHKDYMERINRPLNLLDKNSKDVFYDKQRMGNSLNSEERCDRGVPQNLNKGGTSKFEQGDTSKFKQGGCSKVEQPPSYSEQGGCSNPEVGVAQNLNPNLYPNNNYDPILNLSIHSGYSEELSRDGLMDSEPPVNVNTQKYEGKPPEDIINGIINRTGATPEQIQRAVKRANDIEAQGKLKSSYLGLLESICKTIITEDQTRELASGGDKQRRRDIIKKLYLT